jgi:hypothetical protein
LGCFFRNRITRAVALNSSKRSIGEDVFIISSQQPVFNFTRGTYAIRIYTQSLNV